MKRFDWPSCAGFAYIWVLLLVAFLAAGLTVATETYNVAAQRDKEQALLSIGHQFRSAIGRYYETQSANGGQRRREYPASLDDLLRDSRYPGMRRYLRRVFVDPMTGRDEWGLLRVGGRIVGVYSLSESTPIKQDHFEAEDMAFRQKERYRDWIFTYPPDLLLRPEVSNGEGGSAAPGQQMPANVDGRSHP